MSDNENTSEKQPLCPDCGKQWMAWLDYRITPPITFVQIGKPTARRIQEAQEARFREWRDTIRFQQDLIERICRENHDSGTPGAAP
ncbi:hypothetical protein JNUCC0626_49660 (plasmid) [Lentzea sp. JNUCC 0626]|uniref:hypothetical protein n=1 Tax=Lentzea sp. JNUCC 0626 TaxID=3367513 RepID=UPI003748132F